MTAGVLTMLAVGAAAGPAAATYPGQNGKIYFDGCGPTVCSTFDVWSVNPDGTGLDNVTDQLTAPPGPPDAAFAPSVSADGTRIAFGVDTQATAEIWVMNVDGSGAQQLTNDNLLDQEPAISPDGSRIVWNQWSPFPGYGDRDIWIMNSDGTGQQLLFDGFQTDLVPTFTPDGGTVVMEAESPDQDVAKVSATPAAPPLQLATDVAADNTVLESNPSVSPDGARVAFTQAPFATPAAADIHSVGINGGARTPLFTTAASETAPAYSPDGTRIAFLSDFTLMISNADGSGPGPVDVGGVSPGGGVDWAPAVAEPPPADGDTTPPDTAIAKGPKKKTKKKQAKFEFSGTDARAVAGFQCSLDGGAFAACTSPHTVKVKKGKHTFSVRATDQADNVDATPASQSWKVKKKKKKK